MNVRLRWIHSVFIGCLGIVSSLPLAATTAEVRTPPPPPTPRINGPTIFGDANDIHPTDKKPVGERLALAARALAYGEQIEYSGPLFESFQIDGQRAVLKFSHATGGLVAQGSELKGFTIAGADKVFQPARAKIMGDTVEVSADGVSAPTAVRYAWANVPEDNLWNQAGLPASPFATDSN
jgi:sialate O-acetylesterase